MSVVDNTRCPGCGFEPLDVSRAPITLAAEQWWCDRCGQTIVAFAWLLAAQVHALRAEIETSIYATIQGANYEADERPECSPMASRDASGLAGEMFDAVLGLLGGGE